MKTDDTIAKELSWENLLMEAVSKPGRILEAYHHFHSFSIGNALWALMQCYVRGIQPGPLHTFPGWKSLNRHVKKGEHAIKLVMPVTCKRKDEEEGAQKANEEEHIFTRFIIRANWFVLAQTEGENYGEVELPNWDAEQALAELVITKIDYDSLNGNAQGYAQAGRKIAISPLAALPHKTLFHECAHIILGHTEQDNLSDDEQTPRNLCEVEAEAMALLCCESLGLEGEEYARGYIQSWLGGSSIPEKTAQKIFSAAHVILKAGKEKQPTDHTEETV